jgi:tetratricopeptide (TPR) repeat protein
MSGNITAWRKIMNANPKISMISIFIVTIWANTLLPQDEFNMSDSSTTNNCIPESLHTPYDNKIDTEFTLMEIRKAYSFGQEHFKNKNYQAALSYFWSIFIHDSTKYAKFSINKIADCYYHTSRPDSLLIACYRGIKRFQQNSKLHYYAGLVHNRTGRIKCAIHHYRKLVELETENIDYIESLAFLLFKDNNIEALELQEKVVDKSPKDTKKIDLLLSMYEHFEESALNILIKVHSNNPGNRKYTLLLAETAQSEGKYEFALEPVTKLLSMNPKDGEALKIRAQCYEGLENYKLAINDYKSLLALQNNAIETLCSIALNYKNLNNFSQALTWVKKAKNRSKQNGLPYITNAEIYESAVPYCQGTENRDRKVDDGLVYFLAIEEYEIAMRYLNYKAFAKSRIELLKPLLPTTEELFMRTKKKITRKCYTSWIKKQVNWKKLKQYIN